MQVNYENIINNSRTKPVNSEFSSIYTSLIIFFKFDRAVVDHTFYIPIVYGIKYFKKAILENEAKIRALIA